MNPETPTQQRPSSAVMTGPVEEPASAIYDAIVIGAGPAGMAACIYLARKKMRVLLITKDLGGQAAKSSDVENYLGYSMITGAALTQHFQEHLQEFKEEITLKLMNNGVDAISRSGKNFSVRFGNGSTETARSVVIASGKDPRHLGIPGETEFMNRGVTFCAWCDGPLFKDKSIAVIGGGNSALDAVLAVERIVKDVVIVNVTPELTADEAQVDKATAATSVRIMNNHTVTRIVGDKFVTGIVIQDNESKKEQEIPVEGVFIEVGWIPATDYLKGFIDLNDGGEIKIDKYNMTSVEGIFAAGDVTDVIEKQIIVAAGEGSKAGIQCGKWLSVH